MFGSFHTPDEALSNLTMVTDDDWIRLDKDRLCMLSADPDSPGEFQIEDSLVDDDDDAEVDDAKAQIESEADIVQSGILKEYLKGVLESIKFQIAESSLNQPECYYQGTFWIRPRDPIFALYASRECDPAMSPTELYHRAIFVWLPDRLPGSPDAFKCACGHSLTLNGWNDNPIARRVKSLHHDYFLLTNRFLCRRKHGGCGLSYQGTDPYVMSQLPRHLQESFPALLTARAALDKNLLSVMRTCFATRFGPEPFAALLAEMRYLDHAHRELLYLAALVASPESAYSVQHQPFSAFDDKERYAGTVPSKNYCKAVFAEWMRIHRPYFDRVMASLPGSVLKGDHTFWVSIISHQGYFDSTHN